VDHFEDQFLASNASDVTCPSGGDPVVT